MLVNEGGLEEFRRSARAMIERVLQRDD